MMELNLNFKLTLMDSEKTSKVINSFQLPITFQIHIWAEGGRERTGGKERRENIFLSLS